MTAPQPAVSRPTFLPADWITVRDYAVRCQLPTGDIGRLQQHGKQCMAEMMRLGITSVPKVWEQADNGQVFWVYVYPEHIVTKAAWSVWR